jgi:hypothetical protein
METSRREGAMAPQPPKDRGWAISAWLSLSALVIELMGVLLYMQGHFEKEGAVLAAAGCFLLHFFSVVCLVLARTWRRRIIGILFIVVVLAHWIAVAVGIFALGHASFGGHVV